MINKINNLFGYSASVLYFIVIELIVMQYILSGLSIRNRRANVIVENAVVIVLGFFIIAFIVAFIAYIFAFLMSYDLTKLAPPPEG
jgi:hypothetical protein